MVRPTNELNRLDREDLHRTTLTEDYYLGVFEVTQYQWAPSASGQRNAGRWLAGARFLQVLNWVQFGIREGFWQG